MRWWGLWFVAGWCCARLVLCLLLGSVLLYSQRCFSAVCHVLCIVDNCGMLCLLEPGLTLVASLYVHITSLVMAHFEAQLGLPCRVVPAAYPLVCQLNVVSDNKTCVTADVFACVSHTRTPRPPTRCLSPMCGALRRPFLYPNPPTSLQQHCPLYLHCIIRWVSKWLPRRHSRGWDEATTSPHTPVDWSQLPVD